MAGAKGINAQQQWDIAGLILDNLSVSDDPRLQALIETASLFSKGSVTMQENVISGAADFIFDKLALQAQGNDEYTQIIAQTLSTLDSLAFTSKYSGDVFAPVFSLKSDLDNRLGKALVNGILADQAGPLAELRQSLQAQAAEGLGISNSELGQVTNLLQLANGDLTDLEGLLSSELGGSEQIKDKLLDKLKGKLFSD
jgi:predicted XRE-type DNA-binding protein